MNRRVLILGGVFFMGMTMAIICDSPAMVLSMGGSLIGAVIEWGE